MRRLRTGAYLADRLFVAGLGVVMAITIAFFVMAIPSRIFEAIFSVAGASGMARVGQGWVAIASSVVSGVLVSLFFVPPRKRPAKRTAASPAKADAAEAGSAEATSLEPGGVIAEGVLHLLDIDPAGGEGEPEEICLFVDIAALRAQGKAARGSGVRLRPARTAMH